MAQIGLPKARIAKIMKVNGADRISQSALDAMSKKVLEFIVEQTKNGCKMAKHAGRKTIMDVDLS